MSVENIDNVLFNWSIANSTHDTTSKFIDKRQQFWVDQNQGSYSNGYVLFNVNMSAGERELIDWANAYTTIPLVMTVSCPGGVQDFNDNNVGAFLVALKNNSVNLFNYVIVSQNGKTIHQQSMNSNMYYNFKSLTEMTREEAMKYSRNMHFSPDNHTSATYSNVVSSTGIGNTNNSNTLSPPAVAVSAITASGSNIGLYERQLFTAYNPAGLTSPTGSTLLSTSMMNKSGRGYCVRPANTGVVAGSSATGCLAYHLLVEVKLKHLSSFFENCPLLKASNLTIQLGINQGTSTIGLGLTGAYIAPNAAAAPPVAEAWPTAVNTMTINATSLIGTATQFPVMLSSCAANNGASGLYKVSQPNIAVSVGVAKDPQTQTSTVFYNTCRLYANIFTLTPEAERLYLTSPTRKIKYIELMSSVLPPVIQGGGFTYNVSSSVVNPQFLLVCPFYTASSNCPVGIPTSSFLSPFASSPATLDLYSGMMITDYNVLINGRPLYRSNIQYSYEWFQQEISQTGLNGSYIGGLTSGFINQDSWEKLYGYFFTDLSRRSETEKDIPMSISIQGTNQSTGIGIDLYCFIGYIKEVEVDILSGNVVI